MVDKRKLVTIFENVPKVFESGKNSASGGSCNVDHDALRKEGYDEGYTEGEASGYNTGFEEGKDSVPNPLEYATNLDTAFLSAAFPENYELTLNIPYVKSLGNAFNGATKIKKITLIGNTAGNPVSFNRAFRSCGSVEVIDLTQFIAKPTTVDMAFFYNNALKEIKGELDFSECTTIGANAFIASNLEEIRFKEQSIKLSIDFKYPSKLSAASVDSIVEGLATVSTAQTITFHSSIALTDEQKATISSKGWTLAQ